MGFGRIVKAGLFFRVPDFADPDKALAARQVLVIVRAFFVFAVLLQLLQVALVPKITVRWLALLLATLAVSLALLECARRGHVRLASFLLVLSLWLLVGVFAWTRIGLGTWAAYGYFIVVFIAGMVLGKWPGIITAAICSVSTLVIALAAPVASSEPIRFWLVNSFFLLIVHLLQSLSNRSINELLAKTGSELRERLLAQAALFESERKHREMVNSLPFCVFEADLSGHLTFVNQTALDWFGYTKDEFLAGVNVLDIVADVDKQMAMENIRRIGSGEDISSHEYLVSRRDGSHFMALSKTRRILENGVPVVLQGSLIDISERKQAEKEREHVISLLKATLESTTDAILVVDLAGRIAHFNQQFVQLWQIPDEILALKDDTKAVAFVSNQLIDPRGFVDRVQVLYTDLLAESFDLLEFKDGRYFERYSRPQLLGGRPVGRVWSFRDITERKRAENSLRYYSEFERLLAVLSARFIGIQESMIDAEIDYAIGQIGEFAVVDRSYVFLFDQAGEFMSNTHEWCAGGIESQKNNLQKLPLGSFPWWMGKLRANEEISLERLSDLPPEAEAERKILEAQSIQSLLVVPIRAKDTLIGYLGFDSVRQAQSWPATSLSLIRMISDILASALERKRAEKEISAWKQRFENVSVASGQIVYDYKFDTGDIYWSGSIEKVLGYQMIEMNGGLAGWKKLIDPQDRDEALRLLDISLKSGEPYYVEYGFKHKNGHYVKMLDRGFVMNDAAGQPERMIGMMQDITVYKRAETALQESEQRYRTLFESASDSIFVMKEDIFFDCNSRTLEMFGCRREDILGASPLRFSPPSQPDGRRSREKALEKIHAAYSGFTQFFEWLHLKADGTIFPAEVSLNRFELSSGTYLLAVVRDITDRRMLEEQLRQAQKMEAIGILAGGVAHDFNNILSTIVGYTSLLQMKLKAGDPFKEYIERILSASERAVNLTSSLLAFSRKQEIELRPLDINDTIYGFHKILARLIGEDIDFHLDLASQTLVVDADVRQIEQLLMNLANNSRDAMPRGGKLTIRTEAVVLTETRAEIPAGSYAVVTVADSGTGMSMDVQAHIFEPFFTTKEVGKGTGLGLAMVYGIVKKHNGFIHMTSTSGAGTVFSIYLPLKAQAVKKTARRKQEKIPTGSETILLIEDDAAVRQVTRSMLEEFGYAVLEAANGIEAQTVFQRQRDQVQLVLCDLIMPRMNGRETHAALQKIKGDIKVVFMSGYTADIIAGKGIADPGIQLLQKPLNPSTLLKKIRRVLDK
ncbi:MAG: PAS domain S-box protein [Candidatus Aminicenantes bacterium]|nr:PAS domain S-box protein [Candidatus Aminicenantes bacterium]